MKAPMSDQEFAKMMQKARKRDANFERVEAETRLSPPKNCDLATHLRTAEAALECAVRVRDWQTVCEGIVLLQQATARVVSGGRTVN